MRRLTLKGRAEKKRSRVLTYYAESTRAFPKANETHVSDVTYIPHLRYTLLL